LILLGRTPIPVHGFRSTGSRPGNRYTVAKNIDKVEMNGSGDDWPYSQPFKSRRPIADQFQLVDVLRHRDNGFLDDFLCFGIRETGLACGRVINFQ